MATRRMVVPEAVAEWPATRRDAETVRWVPGSAEAEAAADALLLRARGCGRRMARALRAAVVREGRGGAGLLRAADELLLSCTYYTEAEVRRRGRAMSSPLLPEMLEEMGEAEGLYANRLHWLSGLVAAGLDELAGSLGLSAPQAAAWIGGIRGETQEEVARALGVSRMAVWAHQGRAQRKAADSWLAAYRADVRARN